MKYIHCFISRDNAIGPNRLVFEHEQPKEDWADKSQDHGGELREKSGQDKAEAGDDESIKQAAKSARARGKEAMIAAGKFNKKMENAMIESLRTAGEFYAEKAQDLRESILSPLELVETLLGLGLIAKDKVVQLIKEVNRLMTADIDWAQFSMQYVRDGVVDVAKTVNDFGEKAVVFWKEVAADSYKDAVATGKHFVRRGKEIFDITTVKGREAVQKAPEE